MYPSLVYVISGMYLHGWIKLNQASNINLNELSNGQWCIAFRRKVYIFPWTEGRIILTNKNKIIVLKKLSKMKDYYKIYMCTIYYMNILYTIWIYYNILIPLQFIHSALVTCCTIRKFMQCFYKPSYKAYMFTGMYAMLKLDVTIRSYDQIKIKSI